MKTGSVNSLNGLILDISTRIFPDGFDILVGSANYAPGTLEEINSYVSRHHGRFQVWAGASDHTIFGSANINIHFRAWHDWSHHFGQFDFTLPGEADTAALQRDMLRTVALGNSGLRSMETDHWCRILDAEIIGQSQYYARYGEFPIDQGGFNVAWIANPYTALERVW